MGSSTARLRDELQAGTPATLRGPYGQFDFSVGGARQIWVAGGIGIALILGWLSTPLNDDLDVDLFYTARSETEMAFRDELARTVAQRDAVRLHLHPKPRTRAAHSQRSWESFMTRLVDTFRPQETQ